ncbi:DNA primase [Halothermothrix orenii]|uniref:DNA primase n=1 Tax=Halothermothrix orenii (strain H 168 / OCM 544 / DSM 9562) TaxID=373903 RepID=B8CXH2_HALOH|nr:DNA primase [Halothermothrix orenii]ACL69991.1 DNA primase [Halothermothrix orenii H 168]
MGSSFEKFLDELKGSLDIVDLVSDYVDLKKVGKNYVGLCPFHQEKTPSFTVNPERQFFYCFGCGVGGDVISFLMEIENITFKESVKMLARRSGMEVPGDDPRHRQQLREREKLFKINHLTAKFYHYLLLETDQGLKAINYLKKRGFTKKDIKKFGLGYAPDRWDGLLKFLTGKGFEEGELVKAGLVLLSNNNNYYDRFRDRLIFPIFNSRGEVLAFGGRLIDSDESQPKYLNSPETPVFNKGKNLYGLNWAKHEMRKSSEVIIMEGYTDVLRAHQMGINNVVASLGTALTSEQARLIARYSNLAYISYDADTAGTKATLRGLDILKNAGLNVKVVDLPQDSDPDEYLRKKGVDEFYTLLEEAVDLVEFKIKQGLENIDLNNVQGKIEGTRKLVKILATLEDRIEREIYIQNVSDKFNLDPEILKSEVEKLIKINKNKDKNSSRRYTKKSNRRYFTNKNNKTNSFRSIHFIEEKLLHAFIDFPELRNTIVNEINTDMFSKEYQEVAEFLWENKDSLKGDIINNIESKVLRNKVMELMINNKTVQPEGVERLIVNFKEENVYNIKVGLYKKLQENNLNVNRLNKLLINFQKLSGNHRKEGL